MKHRSAHLFGVWSAMSALLSPHDKPWPGRVAVITRLHMDLEEVRTADNPDRECWRNLADAMNYLQSCAELGVIEDPQGAIDAAKAALLDGHQSVEKRGKLRVNGQSLSSLANLLEQLASILDAISERQHWTIVRRTEKRIGDIWRGKVKRGDVVVHL